MSNNQKMTSEEMLAEVNNAITAIMVGGQSYKIGSRSLTRANLSELRALRDQLMAENARGADEGLIGGCFVAEFLPR